MAVNDRLVIGATAAPGGLIPSENFGVALYEGDGESTRSVNGGKFGAAAFFNGTSSIIQTSGLNNATGQFNNGVTISAWVFITDYTTDTQPIVRNKNTSTQKGISLTVSNTGYPQWQVTNASNVDSITSTTQLSNNTWYHLVGVREPGATTNAVKLYINGSLDAQINGTITIASIGTFTNQLAIGNRSSSSDNVNQKIDQLLIFSKPLSASEVTTLYNQTLATSTSLNPLNDSTVNTFDVFGDGSCLATYQFENNELDLGGNYNGTGAEIEYAVGRYGQAASFNGSGSKLDTGYTFTNTTFSVSVWFKTTTTNIVITNTSDSTPAASNDGFRIYPNKVVLTQDDVDVVTRNYSSSLVDGNWHNVIITNDGSTLTVYIDGGQESTDSSTSFTQNNSYAVVMGYQPRSTIVQYFDGEIDQVRFFNKAISASEATSLYNENSLLALYRFEGNANDDTRNYDGSPTNVTYEYGLGFTPDFVWIKRRDANNYSHRVFDTTRGATKFIRTNETTAEQTDANTLKSFDTGGFTVGSNTYVNIDGGDFVAWCLKANGGTTSSNTDGTITSTVQANTDAGFSIVKHTNSGSTSSTVGHGLGVVPKLYITKKYTTTTAWWVYTTVIDGSMDQVKLNSTDAKLNASINAPTSSVFYNQSGTADGAEYITYCFAEVQNFSKFGTYTGNGSTNGPIVETGFEPAFLMIKPTSAVGSWRILDNKRNLTNPRNSTLKANESEAEITDANENVDFLSNGFQIKTSHLGRNSSGVTYLYMAFAADPDTEQPTVAKSFSTVTYTGNGTSQDIEGLGFSPSLVWLKSRSATGSGRNYNILTYEGPVADGSSTKYVSTNSTAAQASSANTLTSLDSDGFRVYGTGGDTNSNGVDYVAWTWKANDNEPTINTEGSIDSLVSANANAGFSIVKYEGNGTSGTTIGHGLSATPEFIIVKELNNTNNWQVYSSSTGATKFLYLNSTIAAGTATNRWNDTTPTSTVFTVGDSFGVNRSSGDYIAYCFHSVSSFSKIGSYTGNGSTTGPTVTTGFQPDFVMIKRIDNIADWVIVDSIRGGSKYLKPNSSDAETSSDRLTFTSTGFQLITTGANVNFNGDDYIYAAFKIN